MAIFAERNAFTRLLRRPVLWGLVYGGLIAYGVYALLQIPVEVLPRFDFPQIAVIVHRQGATPEELESVITRPIEGQVLGIPELKSVHSVMGNGTVEIEARFSESTSAERDLQAVNAAIDRARARLPPSVHARAVIMGNAIDEVADYTVHIPHNVAPMRVERAMRAFVVPALRALPGVQRVEVFGVGNESLWIRPDLVQMRRYGVSVTALADAVRNQVLLDPAGYLAMGHQDVPIEARHLPTSIASVGRATVPGKDGPIALHNLASIVRAPIPTHNAILLDGHPSVAMIVFKQPTASTIPVTQAVAHKLKALQAQLPSGARWVRIYSQGHLVKLISSDLGRNLLIGALLAIGVLFWILGAGRGVWALALSIPLALLLGIAGLYALGQSLNLLTFGALTVAVGLLVDDAIIVLEAVYHRWEQGSAERADRWEGIWRGLRDIASPDVSGTISTVSVFLPLLFVGGLAGLFFVPFALAMGLSLLASLLISLSFIPLALGFLRARPGRSTGSGKRAVERLRRKNTKLLELCIARPGLMLGGCVGLLVLSIGGLVLVPVSFLPLPNEGVLLESFTLPPGTSLTDTRAAVRHIVHAVAKDPAVLHTDARIGSSGSSLYTEPAYAGEIQIALKPGAGGNSLDRIARHIRHLSRMTGVQLDIDTPTIERVGESLSGLPQPFVLDVYGNHIPTLRTIAKTITSRLHKVHDLTDIFDNDGYPVTQLRIVPRVRQLARRGINPRTLYRQVDPLLGGEVLDEVPDGTYPLVLYMRLANAPSRQLNQLRRLPIQANGWVPLGQLARLKMVSGPNQIRHIDGARALEITAIPLGPLGSTMAAARRALSSLHLPPGYRIAFGGLFPQIEHAAIAVLVAAVVAFALVLGILVLQFDGLLVPGLLMLQLPLAFTGGALALVISGVGLNAIALIGFLTLIGISLNHGIVLLHRTRRNEAEGMSVEDAVHEAVHVRFRPILLTTLTAALGMLPTAVGWGRGAAPEQGLAVVILGGILWSALLSTNLIPALYLRKRRARVQTQA